MISVMASTVRISLKALRQRARPKWTPKAPLAHGRSSLMGTKRAASQHQSEHQKPY